VSDVFDAAALPRKLDDPPERDESSAPPGVIDAHVHIFPREVFAAIRRWFDEHAWSCRYQLDAEALDAFLSARGVERYLGLHYAHKPGMAEQLNEFALEFAQGHPRCIPCATVFPGEPNAEGILDRALTAGARAVKLHGHVQRIAADDPRLDAVYGRVVEHGVLLIFHNGSAPAFSAYGDELRALCTVAALERALRRFPEMRVCVPHFGFAETAGYVDLLGRYPNLYLDTAMGLAGFFPFHGGAELLARHSDRILYGTDMPNLPYAWDRDLRFIEQSDLDEEQRRAVLGGNARRLLLGG